MQVVGGGAADRSLGGSPWSRLLPLPLPSSVAIPSRDARQNRGRLATGVALLVAGLVFGSSLQTPLPGRLRGRPATPTPTQDSADPRIDSFGEEETRYGAAFVLGGSDVASSGLPATRYVRQRGRAAGGGRAASISARRTEGAHPDGVALPHLDHA